ncbi:MAG: hypothetical protein ACYC40_02915 [Patescibacteria group bacterium]
MDNVEKSLDEFVSHDRKRFKWRLGKALASSLSGFIAGIIVATLFFITVFDLTLKSANIGF